MPIEIKGKLPTLAFELELTAGIHAKEGAGSHGGGKTNADIGSYHEFGYGPPQRSWLRAYFDENESRIGTMLEEAIADAIVNDASLKAAADLVAVRIEGEIKERIYAGIAPGLSPEVRAKRGESAVPLIDTGQFIGAIRAHVALILRDS